MHFSDVYGPGQFGLSFELFPPRTPAGDRALMRHMQQLVEFSPSFVTCTYGAGGSTREKTLQIVGQVKQQFAVPVASHLTCVASTVEQLREYLTQATEIGVDHIVALRGDPPQGDTEFQHVDGGLQYANELVEMVRGEFPRFGIVVGGYPETHREAPSPEIDLDNLRRKVDAGADVIVTQLFYDNNDFFSFLERCQKKRIQVPVVPGLLPITNLGQVQRISTMCGAALPKELVDRLAERDDKDWQFQVGVEHAVRQVEGLLEANLPGLHFYVLNKSEATSRVLQSVDLKR